MGEGTVLLRRSSLGDVVLLGAVTSRVPGPVTVVTAPEWASVAARLRGVDRVVTWPRATPAADLDAGLPAGRRIDLHRSTRSCRISSDAALDKRSLRRRLRRWLPLAPRPSVPALYAEACGVDPAPLPWIDVPACPRDALVLAPGARRATKRWAPAHFAAVGRAWSGPVVVLGGPCDTAACEAVAAAVPGADLVVERGFDAALAVLARAAVAVVNDSGLMHLAGACGVRVVAVFGSTHPDDGFFVYPGTVVQRDDLRCRPCTLHGRRRCPLGHLACLDLAPAQVIAAVHREAACAG